jgi:hypothetical protein
MLMMILVINSYLRGVYSHSRAVLDFSKYVFLLYHTIFIFKIGNYRAMQGSSISGQVVSDLLKFTSFAHLLHFLLVV